MLDYVRGSVRAVHGDSVTVDVGSIALLVNVPMPGSFQVGKNVELHTHLHWNQEQGPSLYGFVSEPEKQVFLLIIGCSGVGPKLGLAVLQYLGAQAFLHAILQENDKILSKVSGIGAKKAEQIIVQLKHKVPKLIQSGPISCTGVGQDGQSGNISRVREVADVLDSLNYSRQEISAAINHLGKNYSGQDCSFDQLLRYALSFLSKKI